MRRLYDWLITINPIYRSAALALCYCFLTPESSLNHFVMAAQVVILINLMRRYYRVHVGKDKC